MQEAIATEARQAAALRTARSRATGLLALVAAGLAASFALPDGPLTGYLRAALEAGLVGGLADWFAVVALFRYPLGIPIPHTAVIPRSKEGLGANLATFVEGNFLGGDQVRERLADPEHVDRFGAWLADREHADRVAARVAAAATAVLDSLDEDLVVARVARGVRRRIAHVPAASLAGGALEAAIREHRHDTLVTATVQGIRDTITRNRAPLRRRLGEQSPAWVPDVVDDIVFQRAEQVVQTFLAQLAADPSHELRRALDEQLLALTTRLRTDPEVAARLDTTIQDILTDELLHGWIRAWWREIRAGIEAAGAPSDDSGLRRLTVEGLVDLGQRLRTGGSLHDRVVAALASVAPQVAEVGQREIGGLIATTIDRWDAEDTSRRLELWMGRDLQFVRINGTVVGALVGVVLHALTGFAT